MIVEDTITNRQSHIEQGFGSSRAVLWWDCHESYRNRARQIFDLLLDDLLAVHPTRRLIRHTEGGHFVKSTTGFLIGGSRWNIIVIYNCC